MFARLLFGAIICSVFVGYFCYENKRQSLLFEEIEDQEGSEIEYPGGKYQHFRFAFHLGQKAAEAARDICDVYGEGVIGYSTEMMYPDIAVVKRCYNIGCQGNKTCMPTKMMKRKVAVRVTDKLGNNHPRCSWINVIEHTECTCGCQISGDECTAIDKMYNPLDCTCKCRNEQIQKRECNLKENMIWDEENCICTCPPGGMQCSTGATWVPQFCRCMQVNMEQEFVQM